MAGWSIRGRDKKVICHRFIQWSSILLRSNKINKTWWSLDKSEWNKVFQRNSYPKWVFTMPVLLSPTLGSTARKLNIRNNIRPLTKNWREVRNGPLVDRPSSNCADIFLKRGSTSKSKSNTFTFKFLTLDSMITLFFFWNKICYCIKCANFLWYLFALQWAHTISVKSYASDHRHGWTSNRLN